MKKVWQYILEDGPRSGAWNMAVDDYLFNRLTGSPVTFLRFYAWERPTVSLGYSQRIERVVDEAFCRENGIDIVRRITGGKLVLHHREVTYSVVSSDTGIFSARLPDSYRRISEALITGLEKMGLKPCLADAPPQDYVRGTLPCFSYPAKNEIEISGRKIVGSAQKRVGGRFLQHGSIPLERHDLMLRKASLLQAKEEKIRMNPLNEALGQPVSFARVVDALADGFRDYFSIELKAKSFSPRERQAINRLVRERHAHPDWVRERKSSLTIT